MECLIHQISTAQKNYQQRTSFPVLPKAEKEVRRGFPRPQLQSGRAGTCTHGSRTPSSSLPGCTSGKLSHAGTSPAGYGGRESRRCRPPQPMPTPGRPPGHPPELTLGVRAATNSPPPLRETAPASGATYLVVPAARPAGSSTAASGTARHARDAASSSGPSDFQAAHFQAASREASWEL